MMQTRALPPQDRHLMSQGDEFEFQRSAAARPEREQGTEGRHKREHAARGAAAAVEHRHTGGFIGLAITPPTLAGIKVDQADIFARTQRTTNRALAQPIVRGSLELMALTIAAVAGVFMLAGAILGTMFRRILPDHHLNDHSKDVIRLAAGLIATIAALVLGLLITSAKKTYDSARVEIKELAANFILVDLLLERYGPEGLSARVQLRQAIDPLIEGVWREDELAFTKQVPFHATSAGSRAMFEIHDLSPKNAAQEELRRQILQATARIAFLRSMLFEQETEAIPLPFVVALIFWLTVIFASFSLFSPLNPTSSVALVIIALSASSAIFLFLEMDQPFRGLVQISSARLRSALAPLNP